MGDRKERMNVGKSIKQNKGGYRNIETEKKKLKEKH